MILWNIKKQCGIIVDTQQCGSNLNKNEIYRRQTENNRKTVC